MKEKEDEGGWKRLKDQKDDGEEGGGGGGGGIARRGIRTIDKRMKWDDERERRRRRMEKAEGRERRW